MSRAARILALAAIVVSSGCNVSSEVGSRWLAAGNVAPSSGGAITVEAAQSQSLAGVELDLPPHALGESTLIGVAPGASLEGGDWIAAGPAFEWDPGDTLLFDNADFAIPALVPAGRSPGDLLVLTVNSQDPLLAGTFDQERGLMHFSADHLGDFQAVLGKSCAARDGCAQGDSCVHGFCRPGDGPHH